MWEKVQTDDTPSTTKTRKASVKNKLVSQEGHFSGQGSLQNVQKYKGMGINVRKNIGESYSYRGLNHNRIFFNTIFLYQMKMINAK